MDTVLESRYLQKNHLLPNLLVTTRCVFYSWVLYVSVWCVGFWCTIFSIFLHMQLVVSVLVKLFFCISYLGLGVCCQDDRRLFPRIDTSMQEKV